MKKLFCIAFAIILCLSSVAFADKMELPTNTSGSVYLNLNFAGVKQHLFEYDVTVDFSDTTFEYSYSGEYKVNPSNNAVDYSGISGSWTDKEASLSIACNTGSDDIQVYVKDHVSGIYNMVSNNAKVVTITSNNGTSKTNPAKLSAENTLKITYTADGNIPFAGENEGYFSGDAGLPFNPQNAMEQATANVYKCSIGAIDVYITDEFGSGMDSWN